MDIQMPVMDGVTATRTLRQRGFDKPVIALTANAMKGFERELEDGGFTAYETKPIDIDRLLARLAGLLGGTRQEAAPVAQAEVAAADAAGPAPQSEAALEAERVLDGARKAAAAAPIRSRLAAHPRLARVAADFCAKLPGKLDEMQAALDEGRLDALGTLAHWLKGAGGSVGFDALFDPARDLEAAAKAADGALAAQCLERLRGLGARLESPPVPDRAPARTT
jgi:HPt (histidine-containing phosphotransfer) domain-containing protein